MDLNDLALDGNLVGIHYSWDFSLNIKTAGKIKRLASQNHLIEYSIWEDGTLATVNLK